MLSVLKAVVSFYCKAEDKPIERYKTRVSIAEDQKNLGNFKQRLINFLGLKDLSNKFGLGSFEPKLYLLVKINEKSENYSIATQQQFDLELPDLVTGDMERVS